MQIVRGFETILPVVAVLSLVSSSVVRRTIMQTVIGFKTILPCVSVIYLVSSSVVLSRCWNNG